MTLILIPVPTLVFSWSWPVNKDMYSSSSAMVIMSISGGSIRRFVSLNGSWTEVKSVVGTCWRIPTDSRTMPTRTTWSTSSSPVSTASLPQIQLITRTLSRLQTEIRMSKSFIRWSSYPSHPGSLTCWKESDQGKSYDVIAKHRPVTKDFRTSSDPKKELKLRGMKDERPNVALRLTGYYQCERLHRF